MEDDKKYFLATFEKIRKNYLEFEKKIMELATFYKEQPSEYLKGAIIDLCSIAKGQIGILRDLLPKVCDITSQASYEAILRAKEEDIFEISNEVLRNNTK